MDKKKVIVGMSGGVDSSVAAYLLKQQGYDVIGITMKIWQDDNSCNIIENGGCCGLSAVEDARRVSYKIDIPYYVLNFKKDFKEKVIDNFIEEYYLGRTPNPCIACNRYVKWESMLNKALELGADYIATGHYANVVQKNDRFTLKRADALNKDQTYALFNLTQEQLKHTLMPIGEYSKDVVRKIANEIGLEVANKPDSQEICFVEDNNYPEFLKANSNKEVLEGNFVDIDGNILGRHKGIIYYTIGQRKGLGISFGKRMFVKEIRAKENEVVLSQDEDLYSDGLIAEDVNFMSIEKLDSTLDVRAKIRYSHTPCDATISFKDNILTCDFKEPQRAVTPGQAVVFYDKDDCIVCGGTIIKSK